MATTIGTIQLVATIDTSQYNKKASEIQKTNASIENSASKTEQSSNKSFSAIEKIGLAGIAAGAVAAGAAIIKNLGGAIKRVDTLNNATRTFENIGFSSEDTAKAMDSLSKSILGLPTPLDSAVRGMTALASTYGDISKGQKIFSALNNAILGFGGSTAEVDNAITQLSQLPMDGPLDAQTWNSLRNSGLTPVLVAISKDMGMSVSQLKESLGSGKLTVQDFTDALIRLDKDGGGGMKSLEKIAKDATSGIGTGWANMQTAITRGVAKIISSIGSTRISSALSNLGGMFESALNVAASFVPVVEKIISVLYNLRAPIMAAIAAYAAYRVAVIASNAVMATHSALIYAMGTRYLVMNGSIIAVRGAVTALTVAQMALNKVMTLNPIGLVAGAAALLTTALIGVASQSNSTTSATERLRVARDNLKVATDKAKESEDNLKGAQLDAEGAALRVEQAQKNYNEAVRQYGPESLEAREAAYNLKRAEDDLKRANEEVTKSTDEKRVAEKKVADARKEVEESEAAKASAFDGTRAIIDSQTSSLERLQAQLKKDYSPSAAQKNANTLKNNLNQSAQPRTLKQRFLGGPVSAHTPYFVGENPDGSLNSTSELFVPRTAGRIINSGDLQAALKGGSKSAEYNIGTINIGSEVDGERWLQRLTGDSEITSHGLVPTQAYMGAR